MKVIILHGENVEKSRARLQKFIDSARRREWLITRISSDKDSLSESLAADTLFGNKRLFILEKPNKLTKKEIDWLKERSGEIDETMVIYATNLLTKTFIASLPIPDKIEVFETPKAIWDFLDSVYPGNAKNSLALLHRTKEKEAPEFVFVMLASHFKDLYHAKIEPSTLKTSPWRLSKLEKQASSFTESEIKTFIADLAKLDIDTKTSNANLTDSLDFLLVSKLE